MQSPENKPKSKIEALCSKVHVTKHICDHLLGENHTVSHRMAVGVVIMVCGVLLSKTGESIYILHIAADMSGYFIHAVGSIPFIEYISKIIHNND